MPVPVISASVTAAQKAALDGAFNTIITTLQAIAVVNLTPEERQSLQSIDNVRMPYVARTYGQHVVNYPQLIPAYLSLPEAQKDFMLSIEMTGQALKARQVLEMITDMGLLAESEAYDFFRQFYASAQQAATQNVPGADTVVQDLKPLFEQANNTQPGNP